MIRLTFTGSAFKGQPAERVIECDAIRSIEARRYWEESALWLVEGGQHAGLIIRLAPSGWYHTADQPWRQVGIEAVDATRG